jgi:hypothetical protein
VFDSQGRRIAEYNQATGALIREYVWLNWEPVAVIEGGVTYLVRDPPHRPPRLCHQHQRRQGLDRQQSGPLHLPQRPPLDDRALTEPCFDRICRPFRCGPAACIRIKQIACPIRLIFGHQIADPHANQPVWPF